MKAPKLPENEYDRLKSVESYNVLDTLPEGDYDDITDLIASICNVPIALITILDKDRNYFKSHHGIPFNQSPRDISFCGHTILKDKMLIVKDSRNDDRFVDNPLVTEAGAIFYAGVPLINIEGFAIGTLCVFDHEPRDLTELQLQTLNTLGKQVINLLELRRKNLILENTKKELLLRNERLNLFAAHVSHDLKSPLANIMSLSDLLKDENKNILTEESKELINYIEESASILKDYIDGILNYYKTDELLNTKKETIKLSDILDDIEKVLFTKDDELIYEDCTIESVNISALSQILINLVDNALKYNDKPIRTVTVEHYSTSEFYQFTVSDNGIGIPKHKHEKIFEIFKTLINKLNKPSTGIGLSTVKTLVEKLNGTISVASIENEGSSFTFTIAK